MSTIDLSPNVEEAKEYVLKDVPPSPFGSRYAKAYNYMAAPGRPSRITLGAWSTLMREHKRTEQVTTPTVEIEIRKLVPERIATEGNGLPGGFTTKWHCHLLRTLALPLERRSERPTKFWRAPPNLVGGQLLDEWFLGTGGVYDKAPDSVIFEALAYWATNEAQLESDDSTQASALINVSLAQRAGATLNYESAFG